MVSVFSASATKASAAWAFRSASYHCTPPVAALVRPTRYQLVLYVGTNNPQRLNDPLYMGWRHQRISGDEYHAFVEAFIQAVKRRWPNALLQF